MFVKKTKRRHHQNIEIQRTGILIPIGIAQVVIMSLPPSLSKRDKLTSIVLCLAIMVIGDQSSM